MNTYVSQLMQQTGIALPSTTSLQGVSNLPDTFSAAEMPIREEHQEVVVPQPIQSVAPLMERPQASPAIDRAMPADPVENRSIRSENVSDVPAATPTTVSPGTSELTVMEQVEVQTAIENVSTAHQQQPKRNLEQPTIETTTAPPSPREVVEIRQAELVTTQQAADATLTPQTYLQVVRDWVADTPTVIEEVRAVEIDRPTPDRADPTQPTGVKTDRYSPFALEQIGHSEPQQPNLQQDFVLSIGSIHLTIAAPSPEISPPPPIVPHQAAPAPDTDPFRLSRHYLRFR